MTAIKQHEVTAHSWNGVLLEHYWFSPDLEVSLPKHTHEEYQIGLALTDPGEYNYRRAYHAVPVGSVSVIHPGEAHSGCGLRKRKLPTEFLSFYISASNVQEQISRELPYIQPIILDPVLEPVLRRLHKALRSNSVSLAEEMRWNWAVRRIFAVSCVEESSRPDPTPGVRLAREYLDEHAAERLSLPQLAQVAGLTTWHLSRAFHESFGISLHRYQTQRRIDFAKRLLLEGMPPSEVALRTGFAHQSHMGRHFRELLNVGPAAYQGNRKTVISDRELPPASVRQ